MVACICHLHVLPHPSPLSSLVIVCVPAMIHLIALLVKTVKIRKYNEHNEEYFIESYRTLFLTIRNHSSSSPLYCGLSTEVDPAPDRDITYLIGARVLFYFHDIWCLVIQSSKGYPPQEVLR